MAEVGLVASVVGIISLGITVSKGMLDYYAAYRGAHDDVNHVYQSIEALGKTLAAIGSMLQERTFPKDAIDAVSSSLTACEAGIVILKKKLDKVNLTTPDSSWKSKLSNVRIKTTYPFRESTLARLREICSDLRDNLALAVEALNLRAETISLQQLDNLEALSLGMMQQMKILETSSNKTVLDVGHLVLKQQKDELEEIYSWLTPLTPLFQSKQWETLGTSVRQDAGAKALIETDEFKTWSTYPGSTLWCTAGIGKTVTVSYIISHLRQQAQFNDTGVAFIFFSYKDTETQTPVHLIASLLHQLILERPDHALGLKSLYQKHIKQNTRPSCGEITELLQVVALSFSRVLIVIDALDECSERDETRSILLSELRKLRDQTCLLIMSRPMPHVERELRDAVRLHIEANEQDIRNYLHQRLAAAASMQQHFSEEPTLLGTIISRVVEKVKGMFLMARLYLDTLVVKITRRKIKSALNRLPEELDQIYDELIRRIQLQNPRDHADLAMRVLGWIVRAVRPLTVLELQRALAIEEGDEAFDKDGVPHRDLLVSVCAGMVIINDQSDTITLVHYTTQEYFLRGGKALLEKADLDIACTSLTYLLFEDLDTSYSVCTGKDVESLLRMEPLLGYASQHWGDHARKADTDVVNTLATRLLEDEHRVGLTVHAKDFSDAFAGGRYFKPRYHVQGLSLAAAFGLTGVVNALLQASADILSKDSNGQSALYRAIEHSHTPVINLLLDEGASIDDGDAFGTTPLHLACSTNQAGLVRLLLKRGAFVNAFDGYSATPLYRAAEIGSEPVARLLLEAGADVSVSNGYLQTALHRAADCGFVGMVKLLLSNGADAFAKDHYGYTPFYRAADQGYDDVAKILKEHMKNCK